MYVILRSGQPINFLVNVIASEQIRKSLLRAEEWNDQTGIPTKKKRWLDEFDPLGFQKQ